MGNSSSSVSSSYEDIVREANLKLQSKHERENIFPAIGSVIAAVTPLGPALPALLTSGIGILMGVKTILDRGTINEERTVKLLYDFYTAAERLKLKIAAFMKVYSIPLEHNSSEVQEIVNENRAALRNFVNLLYTASQSKLPSLVLLYKFNNIFIARHRTSALNSQESSKV